MSNTVRVVITGDARGAQNAFRQVEAQSRSFGEKLQAAGRRAIGVGTAMTAGVTLPIAALFKTGLDQIMEQETAMAQTAAAIESTGGAAGVTADHVRKLAEETERLTGIDAEATQAGENLLLTFTNIQNSAGAGNDIFDQTTSIMSDMSVALGQDATQSAMMLGRALNDPMNGVSKLTRAGVTFTDQQKEQIRTLQESGDTMGAQRIILSELNREFGGSADAFGNTTAGKVEKLKRSFENVTASLAEVLVPVLEDVGRWLQRVADWFNGLSDGTKKTTAIVLLLVAAAGPLLIVMGSIATAIGAVTLPVLAVIAGIALLVAGVIYAYTHFEGFRNVVQAVASWLTGTALPAIQRFATMVSQWVSQKFQELAGWVREHWSSIREAITHVTNVIKMVINAALTYIQFLWDTFGSSILSIVKTVFGFIKTTIRNAVNVIKNVIELALNVINGDWGAAWNNIKAIISTVWNQIKNLVRSALSVVRSILSGALSGIKALWRSAWSAVKSAASTAWSGIKSVVRSGIDSIVSFVQGIPGRVAGVASGAFNSLKDAFRDAVNFILRGWNAIEFSIPGFSVGPVGYDGFTLGVPDVPLLAKGGNVTASGLAIVGENGPELLNLNRGAQVRPLDGSGMTQEITINMSNKVSVSELGRELGWQLKTSGM